MSIRIEIARAVGDGRLFNIKPEILSDPVERTMVVSPEIQGLLAGPWENTTMERRCGRLRADLEAFVKGDIVNLALVPYQHRAAYMGRLDRPKDEVWDIRSRDPNPGLRLFGRFAEIDVFVALNWCPRSVEWAGEAPLGDTATLNWDFAILECQERWNALFPGHDPVHAEQADEYVSSNVISL